MHVPDTISVSRAAACEWDVIVVGAGPAGAIAALESARRDLRVLLLDKETFPRSKVCGGCFNQRSLTVLQSAGVGALPMELGGQPIKALRILAGSRTATMPLRGGISLSRTTFDAALITEAVAAGAEFASSVRGIGSTLDAGHRILTCQTNGSEQYMISTKNVIAANGLTGQLDRDGRVPKQQVSPSSRIGTGVITSAKNTEFESGTIHMACGQHGYLGVVRVEGDQLDIAAAVDPESVKPLGGLSNVVAKIAADTKLPTIPHLQELPWHGTPLLTRRRTDVSSKRMFLVGDAAGYVEPFTGEGIAWALATGTAVVDLVEQACSAWDDQLALRWNQTHRRIVGRRQWLIRGLASALRRKPLTELLVSALAFSPTLASPFIRWLDASPPMPTLPKPERAA